MRSFALMAAILWGASAFAVGFTFDADVFYFSDSFSYNSVSNAYGRTFWAVAPGIDLDKKGDWVIGWNYDSMGFSDSPAAVATTLTVSDMGPKVSYFMNKDRSWVLAFSYGLICTANYSSAGSTAKLSGSSMQGQLGYEPEISPGILIGAKLNYYKASFSQQIINTTINTVPNSRTAIYPSLALTFRWE